MLPKLERKLVAVGDRVFVTLGIHAPLTVLDAATGETLQVYENTEGTEEIVVPEPSSAALPLVLMALVAARSRTSRWRV